MSVLERIQAEVDSHPVVLFMKGTAQFPMCGFSSRAVQALREAGATQLHTVNVLEEPEIRANLPRFSNWPTFPQLFINGELIGGCEITLEVADSGELARMGSESQYTCWLRRLLRPRRGRSKVASCWSRAHTVDWVLPRRSHARRPVPPRCCWVARSPN